MNLIPRGWKLHATARQLESDFTWNVLNVLYLSNLGTSSGAKVQRERPPSWTAACSCFYLGLVQIPIDLFNFLVEIPKDYIRSGVYSIQITTTRIFAINTNVLDLLELLELMALLEIQTSWKILVVR